MAAPGSSVGALLRSFLKGGPLYVRIRADRLHVRDVWNGKEYVDEPVIAISDTGGEIIAVGRAARDVARTRPDTRLVNGFDHPRTIIGDYTVAEKTLKHAVRELYRGRWFAPAPIIVMHPLEKLEGGLTQVERRALLELAQSIGGRRGHIWLGRELTDHELRSDTVQFEGAVER